MINKNTLDEKLRFFHKYIDTFKFSGPDSKFMEVLKYDHTMRVTNLCKEIGLSIFKDKQDIIICQIIGVFHDIGRWKQYYIYNSFLDHKTEDHAKLSIDVLIEENVLDDLNEEYKQIIIDSIDTHNKIDIENITDEYIIKFAKIIRDADRIDNYILECDNYDSKEEISKIYDQFSEGDGISDEIYESIINKRLVESKHIKNVNDFKFLKLAWIFDFSFPKSFQIVKDNNYVQKIYGSMKNPDERMEKLYKVIMDFVEEN